MQSFLSQVVSEVLKSSDSLIHTTFVLPNKRSGLFLRNILKSTPSVQGILPKIRSIEEFVSEVSGYQVLDQVSLLFEFYGVYKSLTPESKTDTFEVFLKWAPILIQDFNDLDSNLIDSNDIFTYLTDVKRLENWNLDENKSSDLVKKYLDFFERTHSYHIEYCIRLAKRKKGYQGLIYRLAAQNISEFCDLNSENRFVFAGFNALTKSEETIIEEMLLNDLCHIYWDNDTFYRSSENQSGQFFNRYRNSWPYYNHQKFEWENNNINQTKTIHLYGLPKNISQVKQAGVILDEINQSQGIDSTALILGNEKLLPSLLNSLPENLAQANITMGYPLQEFGLNSLFQSLFHLHLSRSGQKTSDNFYYKDVMATLYDPFLKPVWSGQMELDQKLADLFYNEKSIFVRKEKLLSMVSGSVNLSRLFDLVFGIPSEGPKLAIGHFLELIEVLRGHYSSNKLNQEFLFRYYNIFVQLSNLSSQYGYITDLSNLQQVFSQIIKLENMSFQGEPLNGLQIMGLLESRSLDFKNVVITSVNEGFIPAQGRQNSFIPNDIKLEKKIPGSFEKDAIYSYHFFRLFHRAENIHIIYNNITDDFGSGEPSRFIQQLEVAKAMNLMDQVKIERHHIAPAVLTQPPSVKSIEKSDAVLNKLRKLAEQGFSPTSLSNLIRNPIDFYKKSVLGIKEYEEMEEIISSRTFGTIIHDTLFFLYKPFLDRKLTVSNVRRMIELMDREIDSQFKASYSSKHMQTGKNLLSFEIARQFVLNFLNYEISELQKGKSIKILGLEREMSLSYQINNLSFPILLKGKIDRIDQIDQVVRIIDYKTGKVSQSDLNLKNWSDLINEEKFTKAFQVLCYAYMYNGNDLLTEGKSLESGIISFKNLKSGFLKFNKNSVTDETLDNFSESLDELLLDLYNQDSPFIEKLNQSHY